MIDARPARVILTGCLHLTYGTLALAACSGPGEGREEDPGGPATWSLAPEPTVEIGVVSGEDVYQLDGVAGAAILEDGRIAVANAGSSEVRVFDASGGFLVASGDEGEGPGQWRRLAGVRALGGDTVAVFDSRVRRAGLVDAGDGAYLGGLDSARAEALRGPVAFRAGLLVEGVEPGRLAALTPVLDRLDVFGDASPSRVRVEEDGAVLVFPAWGEGSRTVRVFDLEGRHRADLELPPRFIPLGVGRDHVIGVRKDSLDVEFVQVWRLGGREAFDGPSRAEAFAAGANTALTDLSIPSDDVPWRRDVLMAIASAQEIHYAGHYTYTAELDRLDTPERPLEIPEGVEVQLLEGDEAGWMGRFLDAEAGIGCFLAYGAFRLPEGLSPGAFTCWRRPGG